MAVRPVASVYQIATNSGESSMQCIEDAMGKDKMAKDGQRWHENRRNEQVACRTLPIGGGLAHQVSSLAFQFA
jgi:hypothetical protein